MQLSLALASTPIHHLRTRIISVSQSFHHEGTIRTYPLTDDIPGYVWYTRYTVVWWGIPGEFGENRRITDRRTRAHGLSAFHPPNKH